MASRILLLCLAVLTIHNCNGNRWDYFDKTWDNQKRDEPSTVNQGFNLNSITPSPLEYPTSKASEASKASKRANDETDYFQGIRLNDPKFKQDLREYIIATSKDEMWPCYCKTIM